MAETIADTSTIRTRRRWWWALLAALVALVAIVAFSRPDTIAQVVTSIGWSGAGIVIALYATTQFLRTVRIWFAFPRAARPRFATVLAIVAIHQCLNHLLPLRLGEVGFPLLMKRYAAVPVAAAISVLLVVRLQELFVLVVFFGVAVVAWLLQAKGSLSLGWLLTVAVVGAITLAMSFRLVPVFLRAGSTILQRTRLLPSLADRKRRLADFLDRLCTEWTAPISSARRSLSWILTVMIWFNTCFVFMEALRFGGFAVSYSETVLGSTMASLSHVLPINAFGSFGSLEAGWTFGFSILGFDPRGVLAVGFVLHVLLLGFLVVSALVAWGWLLGGQKRIDRPGDLGDTGTRAQEGIVIGNLVDKAHLANPLARRLVANFDRTVLALTAAAEPRTIHEVGCGEGRLTRLIQQRHPVPFRASDFSRELMEENLRQGPAEIQFVCRSIYALNEAEDGADLILCCEVLEHLEDPVAGLVALRRLGARHYILSVPNEPIWRVLNLCRGKYWRAFGNTPGHLNHWSPGGFRRFLEANGFEISRSLGPFPWTMILGRFGPGPQVRGGSSATALSRLL